MSYDFRVPQITASTPEQKIVQIHSYLFQLSEQLRYAFGEVEREEQVIIRQLNSNRTGDIASSEQAQNTFNSIKALIIKSADIVDAYYEEINRRLEGVYVAESEFGIYSEKTTQDIKENSEGIQRLFSNVQEISTDLEEIAEALIEVNAYIKSGLLDHDESGVPIYGIEIGQDNTIDGEKVFSKFARFTASRLSFYDQNDVEVAYISDYRLYITDAQISGNLFLGKYVIDSSDGLLFKWAGE